LELKPSVLPSQTRGRQHETHSGEVNIVGYISRPVVGEGRQTADRQLFFVNSRPCGLPQVAKAINEVYRSYNITQTPFILADLKMDTNAYDVNVSPDKRTILLHDQGALLDALKDKLTELFDGHEQSVPNSAIGNRKLSSYKALVMTKPAVQADEDVIQPEQSVSSRPQRQASEASSDEEPQPSLMTRHVNRQTVERQVAEKVKRRDWDISAAKLRQRSLPQTELEEETGPEAEEPLPGRDASSPNSMPVRDFNRALGVNTRRTDNMQNSSDLSVTLPSESDHLGRVSVPDVHEPVEEYDEEPVSSSMPVSKPKPTPSFQSSLQRMHRHREPEDTATVTIGNTTTVTTIGSPQAKRRKTAASNSKQSVANPALVKSLRSFAAPGTQMDDTEMDDANPTSLNSFKNPPMEQSEDSSAHESESESEAAEDASERESLAAAGVIMDDSEDSDSSYFDESEKKAKEEAKVAKLIAAAEQSAARPTDENARRATSILKAQTRKDATLQCLQHVNIDLETLDHACQQIQSGLALAHEQLRLGALKRKESSTDELEEDQLALSVSKADFGRMHIAGQFNLGFILALRPAETDSTVNIGRLSDELFIIDQHASDEKYNFERLQAETNVQNQRLVHPKVLELTAVEEELLINNPVALAKNGFSVEVDLSGAQPVGRRCKLVSLPMSKEVVFDSRDLEELLALLMGAGDYEGGGMLNTVSAIASEDHKHVPRPSKVRRMFAMRACRSSIMVGRNLTKKQMDKVVKHMGEIDKPWNCPHGRPTMRHLFGLDAWTGWNEGDGLVGMEKTVPPVSWSDFVASSKNQLDNEDEEEEEELDSQDEDAYDEEDDVEMEEYDEPDASS
jgi:DNA mismatch repair protein PMS2